MTTPSPPKDLLFDLDGTLTDPRQGIVNCIGFALARMGHPLPPEQALTDCIGPPLRDGFASLLKTSDGERLDLAIATYRQRFAEVGLFENQVYPGIERALELLRARDHRLWVATSKPTVYARRILEHFGLDGYFEAVHGSELDGTRADKTALIAHVLERESIDARRALMIGDRRHDAIGALANGVAVIGVLWGYGTRDELERAGVRRFCHEPARLPTLVDAPQVG